MSNYNEEHAASLAYVNDAVANAYDKMKTWLTTNIDQLDYVKRILAEENSALRLPVPQQYASAYEAAEELNSIVQEIVSALEQSGYDMTGVKTEEFPLMILSALNDSGIRIVDANEDEWTAEEWQAYVTQHGEVPATPNLIAIHTTSGVFYTDIKFASSSVKWGTYNISVGNLNGYSGGFVGTPKSGFYNTRKLIAQFNPAVLLGTKYAIADGTIATKEQAAGADVLFFSTLQSLQDWGATIGAVGLSELGTAKMYAVDAGSNTYQLYYYNGGGGSVSFGSVRTVPYIDSQNITGVPAAEVCWNAAGNKTWNTQSIWYSYLPSVFELGLLFLNKDSIQAALALVSDSQFSTGTHWSALQANNTSAYYVELAAGTINNSAKSTAYLPRAFFAKE